MLFSLSVMVLSAFLLGAICKKARLPALIGYMAAGLLLQTFNLIDQSVLGVSSQIRRIALVLILLRSGLSLSIEDLKKIGRPALLMCFLPATLEILAVGIFAPLLFGIPRSQAFLLGSVLGAVSPAVVSPRMIEMIEKKQGVKDGVPQLILAGASADDVYAVVLFAAFSSLAVGGSLSFFTFAKAPMSVLLGVGSGVLIGIVCAFLFQKFRVRSAVKVFVLFAVCLGAVALEDMLASIDAPVAYSGLLCTMTIGLTLMKRDPDASGRLSATYNKIWILAEVFLFVLVGASVNMSYFLSYLPKALLVVTVGLILRMAGVALCCVKTSLDKRERLFAAVSYTPKATVQAALIGSLPALLPEDAQAVIVSVAVVAILFTAPLGALAIDKTKDKLVPLLP